MKKVFFALAFFAAFTSFGSAQANDASDAYNESLIKYRYENDQGEKSVRLVATYKHLSPGVRSQPNVCWWDYNQWFNCKVSDKSAE